MQIYENISGRSGISHYEIGDDYITVKFRESTTRGQDTYRYTDISVGIFHLDRMKDCAIAGSGLNGYINDHVSDKYESKR